MRGRRSFVSKLSGAAAGTLLWPRRAAALITDDRARPAAAHGAMVGGTGDVTGSRAIVWSRCDRPARMIVEWSTRESFTDARRVVGPAALPETGFTARVDLRGLPAGQTIAYRVLFEDLAELGSMSLPVTGRFRSAQARRRHPRASRPGRGAPAALGRARRAARLVGGHGRPGMGDRPRAGRPAHLRDDRAWRPISSSTPATPSTPTQPLVAGGARSTTARSGATWSRPEKAKVAETLDEFRGNYRVQPARRQRAPLQRRGAAAHAVGRPRGRSTTGTRASAVGRPALHREERGAAGRARQARLPRVHADPLRLATTPSASTAHAVRPAARGVRDRHAQLRAAPTRPTCQPAPATEHRASSGRAQLDWLKRGLARSTRPGR